MSFLKRITINYRKVTADELKYATLLVFYFILLLSFFEGDLLFGGGWDVSIGLLFLTPMGVILWPITILVSIGFVQVLKQIQAKKYSMHPKRFGIIIAVIALLILGIVMQPNYSILKNYFASEHFKYELCVLKGYFSPRVCL